MLHVSGMTHTNIPFLVVLGLPAFYSLDPATPRQLIQERVDRVVSELGLTDVRNNRIGTAIQRGISGGQKRRVTIGSSLVTLPRILLLDEPTSGLDSRTSTEVLAASKCFHALS